jgi:hypothetical protein
MHSRVVGQGVRETMRKIRLTAWILIGIFSLFVAPLVYGGIASTTGDVVIVPAPASVAEGTHESDTQVIAFQERVGVVLPALPASVSDVPAGTIVNSYLLHFDPVGATGASHQVAGSVTFNEPCGCSIPTRRWRDKLILPNLSRFVGHTRGRIHRNISPACPSRLHRRCRQYPDGRLAGEFAGR